MLDSSLLFGSRLVFSLLACFEDLQRPARGLVEKLQYNPIHSPGVYNVERDTGNELHDILSIFCVCYACIDKNTVILLRSDLAQHYDMVPNACFRPQCLRQEGHVTRRMILVP